MKLDSSRLEKTKEVECLESLTGLNEEQQAKH